ncbi:hypothetical protein Nwat_1145 [Nitrosococcus watsonii C-113]|uniref:Uncharacterized protein n=1 Tax=Nitrosococcus watsoni (strain C-113) TaxID=105559 RepID=D8K5A2_NITWC|nr:hypothetical protein Nwat_1145 [Nitrosococcus watsonii C-113]
MSKGGTLILSFNFIARRQMILYVTFDAEMLRVLTEDNE